MMMYIKENRTSPCKVLVIDGFKVINPTHEMILEQGWEIYTPPTVEPNPTEELLERHREILKLLAITDNEVTRHLEGNPSTTWSDFEILKAQREAWRTEKDEIEEKTGMVYNPITEQYESIINETLR